MFISPPTHPLAHSLAHSLARPLAHPFIYTHSYSPGEVLTLSGAQMEEMLEAFTEFDKDGSGFISADELKGE